MYILVVNWMLKPRWFSVLFLSVILTHSIMFPVVDNSGATCKMPFRHNKRLPSSMHPLQTKVKLTVYSKTNSSRKPDFGGLPL